MTGSLKCVQLLISRTVRHCIHIRPNVFSEYRNPAWDLCRRNLSGNGFANTSGVTSFSRRTHLCGELRSSNVGQEVVLCGWLQFIRVSQFLILGDWQGTTQLVLSAEKQQEFVTLLSDLTYGSVLEVQGTVRSRPEGQKNEKMLTGEIEIIVSNLKLLNPCMPRLPFEPKGFHQVKEALRMEYRYLDLRQQKMQQNLRLRSKMVMKMRHFLADEHEFVEVETPTLFRRTPGGAKEFVVPSRHPGMFYSLPQSPQQFKQLLMVGGVDRYFQIARCYRDEGAKPDRQPEFTQVDLEMSFIDQEGVMSLVENLVQRSWPEERGMAKVPFPRMPYIEAMKEYGSDKPDTRLAWKIKDVTELLLPVSSSIFPKVQSEGLSFQALRIPAGSTHLSNKDIEEAMVFAKKGLPPTLMLVLSKVKANNALSGYLSKHLPETVWQQLFECLSLSADDILFLSHGHKHDPLTVLGRIRLQCADKMEEKGLELRDPKSLNFLWVNEFPLFLPKEDGGEGLESAHHPFTAPHPDDEDLLYTCPEQVRSQHYDLVLNGQEIGGGSIRIHNASMQRHVLSNILKEDCSQLEHLLTALNSGCPPHGGIALGLDRLMAIVCEEKSIRDVIAFPKSHDGRDLMSHSPTTVLQQDLDAYHIVVKK